MGDVPLYPVDPQEALVVDEICDFLGEDIWGPIVGKILGAPKDQKTGIAQDLIEEGGSVKVQIRMLEDTIVGPFAAGPALTIADVYIFAAFGWFASGFFTSKFSVETLLSGCPKLTSIVHAVGAIPEIKEYYAKKDFSKEPLSKVYGQFANL